MAANRTDDRTTAEILDAAEAVVEARFEGDSCTGVQFMDFQDLVFRSYPSLLKALRAVTQEHDPHEYEASPKDDWGDHCYVCMMPFHDPIHSAAVRDAVAVLAGATG